MSEQINNWTNRWLVPIALLGGGAMGVFILLYALDHYTSAGALAAGGAADRYLSFDPGSITDAVSALAAMIAAVLGIVITVVSIIVQLSADRYTGVARMFLADRTNRLVMSYYVVTCAAAVWLSMSVHGDWVPKLLLVVIMLATTVGLVLMLPYFNYVFRFLEPTHIVDRIRHQAVLTIKRAAQAGAEECQAIQGKALTAMEELTDITSNSISGKDKIIASRSVDALKDYCLDYLTVKGAADGAWFTLGEGIRKNPDFVAMDPESLTDLEGHKTWFEWKILRQYLGIYNEALTSMRDINYLIAIDTRYIGERAAEHGDDELITLVFRFMNSYLRSAINARDVRTAYNVLNQYRKLLEAMLQQGLGGFAFDGVKHMKYYGRVSYDLNITFVTETVAYDIAALCQEAHERDIAQESEMLAQFLDLDQPLQMQSQEKGLLGVRKAQVKLAAYYLVKSEEHRARGDEHRAHTEETRARRIADDMSKEPQERLRRIWTDLVQVTSKDFWEIIDRGRNFEYMPDKQRLQMSTFFDWLGITLESEHQRPPTIPPSMPDADDAPKSP